MSGDITVTVVDILIIVCKVKSAFYLLRGLNMMLYDFSSSMFDKN